MLCRERKKRENRSRSIISGDSKERESSTSVPHLFRCPISLDLFTDPVTLATGQTYDRASIERWLAAGNLTCPVTMQKLPDRSLVPNHTLRHLIDQWLLSGPDRSPHCHAGSFSLPALKLGLLSPSEETLRRIRALALESDVGQSCLVQSGFLPSLLQLLFETQAGGNPQLLELALDCVLSLCPSRLESSLSMMKEPGSMSSLVSLLDRGNGKIRTSLCYLLDIASSEEDLCLVLGQNRRLIQRLAALIYNDCAAEAATRAVAGLCSPETNRECAIGSGVVDGLVTYLSHSRRKNAAKALMTLEALMERESGVKALLENGSSVRVLVSRVFCVSAENRGGEHAVGALLAACRGSAQARKEAVSARALKQLLLLLQSQCSAKAKAKARDLLKLLSSVWIDDPTAYEKLV